MHFFWGSFDLAVTRFSGRRAAQLTSDTPNVGAWVMREAYSHEVSSCGFWPGNGGFGRPAFFSYAYPEPEGFAWAPMRPDATYYDAELGQFILPYDAVRQAQSPDATLMDYLQQHVCSGRRPRALGPGGLGTSGRPMTVALSPLPSGPGHSAQCATP